MSGWDDPSQDDDAGHWSEAEVDRAPICPVCGVTTLLAETAKDPDLAFVCENADCEAFGEAV